MSGKYFNYANGLYVIKTIYECTRVSYIHTERVVRSTTCFAYITYIQMDICQFSQHYHETDRLNYRILITDTRLESCHLSYDNST